MNSLLLSSTGPFAALLMIGMWHRWRNFQTGGLLTSGDWIAPINPNGLGKAGFDNGSRVAGEQGIGCNGRP